MLKKHNEDEKKTATLQTVSLPLHREVSLAVSARCDVTTAGVPFFLVPFRLVVHHPDFNFNLTVSSLFYSSK